MRKVAFVSGAASDDGAAIVRQLVKDGYSVAINDKDEEKAKALAKKDGKNITFLSGNVYTEAGADALFQKFSDSFERLDLLVCNAVDFTPDTFEELSADDLRDGFRNSVIPAMLCIQRTSAIMIEKKIPGRILIASTENAHESDKDQFSMSVEGWALRGMTRATAKQLAKADIKVNAYCVGDVPPEGVAGLVSYLASDWNQDITGQNIMVNDGTYMD